jgi:sugar phosphate isomerase/epimerase
MDRRTFLAALAAAATTSIAAAAAERQRLGVQLYTLRNELQQDFEGSLRKVAAIGYKEVEFAGYFGRSPAEVRQVLDAAGLSAPSAHVDYKLLGADFPKTIAAAQTMGHRYLVVAWMDPAGWGDLDTWKRAADAFNKAGEMCRQAGMQFCYHNHHFEFIAAGGQLPYELLLKECDPQLVKMEMDLCWMAAAGADPLDYFRRYPGRFPMVHMKQLKKIPPHTGMLPFDAATPEITEVGPGVVDFQNILAHRRQAGIQHYFVEHDAAKSPFASIEASYRYLQGIQA